MSWLDNMIKIPVRLELLKLPSGDPGAVRLMLGNAETFFPLSIDEIIQTVFQAQVAVMFCHLRPPLLVSDMDAAKIREKLGTERTELVPGEYESCWMPGVKETTG